MKLFSDSKSGVNIAKQLRRAMGEEVPGNYRAAPFYSETGCRIAMETWEHHGQDSLVKLAEEFAKRKGWFKKEGEWG